MIALTWAFLLLPLFLLSIPAANHIMAQSGFTEYDNELFTIAYPSSWTVDETGVGNPGSTSVDETHVVKFNTPSNDAFVSLTWKPVGLEPTAGQLTVFQAPNQTGKVMIGWKSPAQSWLLNKDVWLANMTKVGATVTVISNDTNYLSNSPALMMLAVDGLQKQLSVVADINGTAFVFIYLNSIPNYPTNLNLVNVMLETFQAKGGGYIPSG